MATSKRFDRVVRDISGGIGLLLLLAMAAFLIVGTLVLIFG